MSRYTGPRVRAMRALGVQLPGLSVKPIEKRPFPPGQHGQARRKLSEYGLRLIEKQKLCRNYGITEGQMRALMKEALAAKGPTGERLLQLLESRLDNVVFRAGLARTIPTARQLVNHGHITVDGRKVDVPSFRVRAQQVIGLREKSRELPFVVASVQAGRAFETSWLSTNPAERTATVVTTPDAASVPFSLSVQLVVEFYSQRV